jgi:hypothetical protein
VPSMSAATKAWLEDNSRCLHFHDYTSNMKVHRAVFQLKGERSSMVEDTPATFKHGRRRHVMGNVRGTVP